MERKRTGLLIGCIMLVFTLWGCGGGAGGSDGSASGGGSGGAPEQPATVSPKEGQNTIKGVVASSVSSVLALTVTFDGTPNKATPAKAGDFSLYAYPYPAVVLFVSSSGQNNYLQFPNGMIPFPLENLRAGAVSDLGTLTISGQAMIPGRDPFSDGDLTLNPAEQRVHKAFGSTFSSLAIRPDSDGNGKIDVLEGKFYLPYTGYYVKGSFPAGVTTAVVEVPPVFDHFDLCFQDQSIDAARPTTGVTFTGPAGSGLSNTPAKSLDAASGKYCSPNISGVPMIPSGDYTAAYKGGTLSFAIPDQSSIAQNTLIVVPAVTLNKDGTIYGLSWTYRLGDGTNQGKIDPANVMTGLRIYMTDRAGNDRAYDSLDLAVTATSHVLTNQHLKWSDIDHVEIDLYTPYKGCIIFYFSNT